MDQQYEIATFAGGCFWCMVSPFKKLNGVLDTRSGYTGGHVENPTYKEVKAQTTGHYEAVQIAYDPKVVSYETLLEVFWRQIDPTDSEGQFQDRGSSYKAAIFYENDKQKIKAEASKKALEESARFDKPIVTEILPAAVFYPAEEYHQDFYIKSPLEYMKDREISGRDEFIKKYWGDKQLS
ncbi:MAG: msrA [Sedimentibacter sp.]|jgi:methionine-S-sulfoxide reductase|nr:msrA [Sedimentibacter sp.]